MYIVIKGLNDNINDINDLYNEQQFNGKQETMLLMWSSECSEQTIQTVMMIITDRFGYFRWTQTFTESTVTCPCEYIALIISFSNVSLNFSHLKHGPKVERATWLATVSSLTSPLVESSRLSIIYLTPKPCSRNDKWSLSARSSTNPQSRLWSPDLIILAPGSGDDLALALLDNAAHAKYP